METLNETLTLTTHKIETHHDTTSANAPDIDLNQIVAELQKYIDRLCKALTVEIPKEIREANKQYRDLISMAGDINAQLNKYKP